MHSLTINRPAQPARLNRGNSRLSRLALVLFSLGWLGGVIGPVHAQATPCEGQHETVSPALTDLGDAVYIRMDGTDTGQAGGLYPGGSNVRPAAHNLAGWTAARAVVALDSSGIPDPLNGKIAMISIGMSNTASEFRDFRTLALADPAVNPQLVLVNGATAGRTAEYWAYPTIAPMTDTWELVDQRLAMAGVGPAQVQVAWVKLTRTGGGPFPAKPQQLQADLANVARALRLRYPNIKLAYFSSRTRSYLYWSGLSPEPAAFETGFAVKWLLEQQLQGDPDLNYDPAQGPVTAPWLAWGPYLWIDGLNARSDGRVWTQADLVADCTHPSDSGRSKVAAMLLAFFKTDVTARGWFLAAPEDGTVFLPYLSTPPVRATGVE